MGKYTRRKRCLTKEKGKSPCWEFTLLRSTDNLGLPGDTWAKGQSN